MALVDTIRTSQLAARRDRDTVKADLLTTLLGEIETKAKSLGQDPSTFEDAKVQAIVAKFVKDAKTYLAMPGLPEDRAIVLSRELAILTFLLPAQLSQADLEGIIDDAISHGASSRKDVMKVLSTMYANRFDGAKAGQLIDERLKT